jgi:hypothetical protein
LDKIPLFVAALSKKLREFQCGWAAPGDRIRELCPKRTPNARSPADKTQDNMDRPKAFSMSAQRQAALIRPALESLTAES